MMALALYWDMPSWVVRVFHVAAPLKAPSKLYAPFSVEKGSWDTRNGSLFDIQLAKRDARRKYTYARGLDLDVPDQVS